MSNELDIKTVRQECAAGNIKWTAHVLERMQERNIEPTDIVNCINNGKIIEQYPEAYPYPACLILGTINSANSLTTHIHVVVGYGSGSVWVITAYKPDEAEWINGFTIRKE